jgi:hypothetical protein
MSWSILALVKWMTFIGDQMGRHEAQPFWHGTSTTQHNGNRAGPARGPSWAMLGLRYKSIRWHEQ